MKTDSPTPYDDVNEILDLLLSSVREILRKQLVGMYLFGSLANGDFDQFSDIDILIVTNREISVNTFDALKEMHENIQEIDSPWAVQLEVSYVPTEALRRHDPSNNEHPHVDRGKGERLHMLRHETDWIVQRHILRERGVTIVGPEPKTLIDYVSVDDLRNAMYPILFDWYAHFLSKPVPFGSQGYQSYVVLSLCRILYTLQKGEVVSKPAAARWAKETLDPHWIPVIDRALLGRQNAGLEPLPEDVRDTLGMIRFALQLAKPTPYPDVNEVLNQLHKKVQGILGNNFVGMYLYGSLSSGDFNPETSDIDFLVVTTETLSNVKVARLETMHNETWATSPKRAGKLEGAYVPRELIRRHDVHGAACPTVNEGRFYLAPRGSDWSIQRHVVRESGVVVEGPDPKTLIDFVSPDDIRTAVVGILREWWFPMLEDPSWLTDHGSGYHSFAILTMCRALHALEHGTIVSKPAAARWSQGQLGDRWSKVIEQSIQAQKPGEGKYDLLADALALIRYTRDTLKV